MVPANPPFGKKSSIIVIGLDGEATRDDIAYDRPDFWETTTNKQLNFVQHIARLMAMPGRAAVVVPDNVLFEGGAGEGIRRSPARAAPGRACAADARSPSSGEWVRWTSAPGRARQVPAGRIPAPRAGR
ncbi:N-6 DNA methylase [Sphaerisporangium melleum]|uniref:N-6 DNA methylase n=1 Tax=Sphaerisporangium melleum TaxID=321316 RepID=UPI003558F744